jgi:flagellar basal-body rod protein FlgG
VNASLWVSKTGLVAQDTRMSVIANNLANVNTVGFKSDRVLYQDLFYQTQQQPGVVLDQNNDQPTGLQVGTGVKVVGTQKLFTAGSYATTNQALDLAIEGRGFFQIERTNGEIAYTRDGQFLRNADGLMVDSVGLPLVPNINIPEDASSISIGTDGTVSAMYSGQDTATEIGQITLVDFVNPAGLEAIGGNLFLASPASGLAQEDVAGEGVLGTLKQFALEGSNVSTVSEMVDMITTQRAYEMNAKMVTAANEMLQFINQSM